MLKKTWLTAALLATCSMANAAPYIGASIGKATFDDISGSIKSNTYNLNTMVYIVIIRIHIHIPHVSMI